MPYLKKLFAKADQNPIFFENLMLTAGYAAMFYGLQFFLYKLGLAYYVPDENNLVSWDAAWYRTISEHGYDYYSEGQCNAGFYYLFPVIWKLTGCSTWAICVLNLLFFGTGMSLLASEYKLSESKRMLFLSLPTFIFAFVPYSEALFFILSSLCIWGIAREKHYVVWISLFLLSLTRATAINLIPALLLMVLLSNKRALWRTAIRHFMTQYVAPIALGLFVFTYVQYLYTGVWFAYFKAQAGAWMRVFSVPILPFDGGPPDTMLFNALAIFVCLLATIYGVYFIFNWLKNNKTYEKGLLFSIGYLTITLLLALFFSPRWDTVKTIVIGAFRYALFTPFLFRFFIFILEEVSYSWKQYVFAFLIANIVWLSFGSYAHIQTFLLFTGMTIMVLLYMLSTRKILWPAMLLTGINLVFQIHYFQLFIGRVHLVD